MFLRLSKYYIKITCSLLNLIASKIYLISFLTCQLHFVLFYSCHQKRTRWNLRSKYFTWLNPYFLYMNVFWKAFHVSCLYLIISEQSRFPPYCLAYVVRCSFQITVRLKLNLGIRISLQFYFFSFFLCLCPLPGLFLIVFLLRSQHTLVLRKNVPWAVGTLHFVTYVSLLSIFYIPYICIGSVT